jgi:hypothetical protein
MDANEELKQMFNNKDISQEKVPPLTSIARVLPSFLPNFLYRKQPQKHISATRSNAPTVADALISSRPEYFFLTA